MEILYVSGSTRTDSSNMLLLKKLSEFSKSKTFHLAEISTLPLFQAELDCNPLPSEVVQWRSEVEKAKALIISIPEYIHNLPALIKNALEWVTSSGELVAKPVVAITFTPSSPRGEKAMKSLLWSLKALDANILGSITLYQNEIKINQRIRSESNNDLFQEIINLIEQR